MAEQPYLSMTTESGHEPSPDIHAFFKSNQPTSVRISALKNNGEGMKRCHRCRGRGYWHGRFCHLCEGTGLISRLRGW